MVFGHVVFGEGLSRRAGPLPRPNHQVPKYHIMRPPGRPRRVVVGHLVVGPGLGARPAGQALPKCRMAKHHTMRPPDDFIRAGKKAYCYLKEGFNKFPKCCAGQHFGNLLNPSLR